MRTTVDIPEPLLRQARVRAALDGKKMKDVVNEALVRYLSGENGNAPEPDLPERIELRRLGRLSIPVLRSAHPGAADVPPEKLKEAEA